VATIATLVEASSMPSKSTLNVSLTPELTALIAAKINTGHYRSASEVVRAALRLLDEQDRREGRHEMKPATGGRDGR
jgi:antitoxin ParD1/3/4